MTTYHFDIVPLSVLRLIFVQATKNNCRLDRNNRARSKRRWFAAGTFQGRAAMKKAALILGTVILALAATAGWQIASCYVANSELQSDMNFLGAQIGSHIGLNSAPVGRGSSQRGYPQSPGSRDSS